MSQPKQPCILRVLSDFMRDSLAVAESHGNQSVINLAERKLIIERMHRNYAEFQRLIANFQIQVEPRKAPPTPANL